MTLVKFNRGAGNRGVAPVLNQVFNEFFDNWAGPVLRNGNSLPAVNVSESDTDFKLELQVPGFTKEGINISVDEDTLVISGEHTSDNEESNKRFTRKEFSQQSFTRSFSLPENVDESAIQAKFENGILSVTLPKKEQATRTTRRIELQ